MHITDKDDRPVDNYNPIIDAEVDLDAPYIDFNFADGMICDWKNEREYRLLGYISHMSENIADGYLQ